MAEQMDDAQPLLGRCRAPPRARALAAASLTASEGSIDAYARHLKMHTWSLESAALQVHTCIALAQSLQLHVTMIAYVRVRPMASA